MQHIHERVSLIVAASAFALIGLWPCSAAETASRDGGSVIMGTSAQVQGFDPLTTRAANRETTMAEGDARRVEKSIAIRTPMRERSIDHQNGATNVIWQQTVERECSANSTHDLRTSPPGSTRFDIRRSFVPR